MIIEQQPIPMISMRLMGKEYRVPEGLTIMTAIEHAGYKLVRGSGCRAGFCGACTTVYRKEGDPKLHTALACQTLLEDGMSLVQVPSMPSGKKVYNIQGITPTPNIILQYYPEVARCIACNTCTRSCPQHMQVMDYIQAALRGDLQKAALLSFDCIQCGICSTRCPVDIKHYHVAQLARRLYGTYILPRSTELAARMQEIESGVCAAELDQLIDLPIDELRTLYENRTLEKVSSKHGENQQLGSTMDPIDFQDELERLP